MPKEKLAVDFAIGDTATGSDSIIRVTGEIVEIVSGDTHPIRIICAVENKSYRFSVKEVTKADAHFQKPLNQQQQAFIDAVVARSKKEILEDIAFGIIDAPVTTFGDLHDHVDANEYGGMCEDKFFDDGNALFPRADGEDYDTLQSQWLMDVSNAIQNAVNSWIQSPEFGAACKSLVEPT